MFDVFKLGRKTEKKQPETIKLWQEHEDLIQKPQQIAAVLKYISQHMPDSPMPLRLMIRGADYGKLVTFFKSDENKALIHCLIADEHQFDLNEELTFIAGWDGKLVAFSAFIIHSYTTREFSVSWPQVMIKSIGRDTYRVHPHIELPLSIELDDLNLVGRLIDMSEGGMACYLLRADAQLLLNRSNLVNAKISIGQLQFNVELMSICSEVCSSQSSYTRLGISFKGILNKDLACIRRSLLEWQY
jgi:hypothetical protein